MTLDQFLGELETLRGEATQAFADAINSASLEAARVEFLGAAKGRLKTVQKNLGAVAKEDKPAAGKRFNEVKTAVESSFAAAQERIQSVRTTKTDGQQFDPTLPGQTLRIGKLHPLTQTIEELKDIMGRQSG